MWHGAYVVIGQTDAESSADQHRTALGMMPGDLVTANEIFTVAELGRLLPLVNKHLYELLLICLWGFFLRAYGRGSRVCVGKLKNQARARNGPDPSVNLSFESKQALF